jgi:hypothetical protein
MFIYILVLSYYKLFLLVRKDKDVNEHERLSNTTLKTQMKVKEQFVVRKDKDVNEHERLSNTTLKTQNNIAHM